MPLLLDLVAHGGCMQYLTTSQGSQGNSYRQQQARCSISILSEEGYWERTPAQLIAFPWRWIPDRSTVDSLTLDRSTPPRREVFLNTPVLSVRQLLDHVPKAGSKGLMQLRADTLLDLQEHQWEAPELRLLSRVQGTRPLASVHLCAIIIIPCAYQTRHWYTVTRRISSDGAESFMDILAHLQKSW